MFEKAVEKLTEEMTKNEKNPYVQMIGQYLMNHLEEYPEHAEQVLADGKTITKSLDAMRRFAETKRVGNMAAVSDADGYGIVLQYFGCWDGEPFEIPAEPERKEFIPNPARTNAQTRTVGGKATQGTPTKTEAPVQMSLFDFAGEAN
ncbi:Cas9 inhibitor AcrIIA9 family protein [Alicyclobacillus sp. ALC3]|uniref:Cas9 inhibitor AcrIIA9 family protein n=1 Tax=Alicyclobacillus sp. ALC3 TaxID=2796143 RepID=UPI002379AF78|nr:Cas9 inhibitor AcrIIA9 family protein [Alicyclobacillus sp. ALC3]WDL99716.1 hypothetical protein JC200_24095 [Alicyclobacillus sp. ALC3]